MRKLSLCVLFVATIAAFLSANVSGAAPRQTIADLSDAIPLPVLRRSVSARFYKSLLISPIDDWIVVRGRLSGTHFSGARVIRSSSNRAHEALALQQAGELNISGNRSIGKSGPSDTVLMHFLIYRIADGTMAVSFAHLDAPGGSQMKYFGSARLLVSKGDGRWTEIKGPESLEGKGLAIRESGGRNNLKLDRIPQHFSSSAPR